MFNRINPAALSFLAISGSSRPLVVMAKSFTPESPLMLRQSSITPFRTRGSPPVRRTLLKPISTAVRIISYISSRLRISLWDFLSMPFSGMQ